MPNFVTLGFFDTYDLVASLRGKEGGFGVDGMLIRGRRSDQEGQEFGAHHDYVFKPVCRKWVELQNVLSRIKREGDRLLGGIEFGRIGLDLLAPGEWHEWHRPDQAWEVLHLAIRTNPGAALIVGTESMHLQPGFLVWVSNAAPQSAINLGQWPRIHLVIDFQRRVGA
ncbi:MAG: aspartyl/asparaginyl beta-hydroxylase domain-containing protein [Patescibacteria group bacterium]|nr:aspartyl/asparaginyl beta-hydroxylase domain-containing protein [Patescibacteria group bacterium]